MDIAHKDLGKDVLAWGQGLDTDVGGGRVPAGVLLGIMGRLVCL